jgi:energy-converting hydrogenase A subunit P
MIDSYTKTPRPLRHVDVDYLINHTKCEKCQLCVPECPTGCITFDEENDTISRDKDKCLRCSICYQTCPFSVIKYFIAKFSLEDDEIIHTTVKASNLNENIVME